MTSKERILAASRGGDVDYVPCAPFMYAQDWPQRLGKRWQFPFGPSIQEQLEYLVNGLGLDQVVPVGSDYYPEPDVSSKVWIEGDIVHKVYTTRSGDLHSAVSVGDNWPHGYDIPLFSDYSPAHSVEPWIKSHEDVERLRHIIRPPSSSEQIEQLRLSFLYASQLAARHSLAVCLDFGMGLTGALQMFGPAALCIAAAEQPDLVDAYLELDHHYTMKSYEIALDLGVDMVRRNGFYESADWYSPAMLEKFLARRLREEIALVREAGKVIGYTLMTGVMPMLDYLAALDFDCIFCLDVFLGRADAREVRRRLGEDMSFWTGPSDTIHMPWERPDEVRKAVRHVFETFGKRGLVITPCASAKAVFPWENVLAMIDEWKKLR